MATYAAKKQEEDDAAEELRYKKLNQYHSACESVKQAVSVIQNVNDTDLKKQAVELISESFKVMLANVKD